MTKEEFDERLEKLDAIFAKYETVFAQCKAEIKELKNAQIEDELPTPPHPNPYPKDNQIYFSFNGIGGVSESNWASDRYDLRMREYGNVFMTKEAAEFAAERMKVLAEMNEWAGKWDDIYVLAYVGNDDIVSITKLFSRDTFGEMHFATKEDAINCIKTVGEDRIKKYYFMIPEEEKTDDER